MMDYIRSLLSFIFAISAMYILLNCKIDHKKHHYLLWLFVTVVLLCDTLFIYYFGYTTFMKLYPLLIHLPVFIVFVMLSEFKPIKVLFILLTLVAISTSFSLVGLIVSSFFGSSREIVNIVCYILYLPTWFTIYKYIRPPFLYMLHNTDKGWLGFCIIPITYSVLIYSLAKYNLDNIIIGPMVKDAVLLSILAFSAYFMIFRFFVQSREYLLLQNEQNLLKTQVTTAQIHLEALKDSQEKTTIYRHDMRHHLNLISAYLVDNNTAAAQKYITEVENNIKCAVVEKYCINYTCNLILSSYVTKAKNEEIKVEARIDLPEKNTISDMDLCVIFSNAIENAVNACKRIPNINDRALKIICKTKNDKLMIQITNSYIGTVRLVDGLPVSPEKNHGLGSKSIAAVVQKYGGVYSFTAEEGVFKTSIIL